MDENDGVRTRLTHSHEVANLARSIGSRVYKSAPELFGHADLYEVVQPILTCIGLAHDLGNPPFGHQGEEAIKKWFVERSEWIFTNYKKGGQGIPTSVADSLRNEFLKFDGNPQSLRLLTKLQTSIGNAGLDLTAATLAASLKYPVSAANRDTSHPVTKKIGYFESERAVVEWFRKSTGLKEGQRHPLTWIMEACDDIAYSVLDVDDAMKKGVISPDDVLAILKSNSALKKSSVVASIVRSFTKVIKAKRRPEIARDIKIGYLRAHLLDALIAEASDKFTSQREAIFKFERISPLMEESVLCKALKKIAGQYAFSNTGVLRMEALGAAAIDGLLTSFWTAISERESFDDILSDRNSAVGKYVFALISPNYLESAVRGAEGSGPATCVRYRELRLLTDMISGMTDTFAIKLWKQIRKLDA